MSHWTVREVFDDEPRFATREQAERFAEDLGPECETRLVEVFSRGEREARDAVVKAAVATEQARHAAFVARGWLGQDAAERAWTLACEAESVAVAKYLRVLRANRGMTL